ncbi:MAG: hypothetical protein ACLUIQ_02680 [Dialister invisus]
MNKFTVRGSQLNRHTLSFPVPAQAVVKRLTSTWSPISSVTECLLPTPQAVPPFTEQALLPCCCTNAEGQGPWANSLFEDNAEFGLGMHLGEIKLRRGWRRN